MASPEQLRVADTKVLINTFVQYIRLRISGLIGTRREDAVQ